MSIQPNHGAKVSCDYPIRMLSIVHQSDAGTSQSTTTDNMDVEAHGVTQPIAGTNAETELLEFAVGVSGESQVTQTSTHDRKANNAVFDMYDIGRALLEPAREHEAKCNLTKIRHIGKSVHTDTRGGRQSAHDPPSKTLSRGQSRRFEKDNSQRFLRTAIHNHVKKRRTFKRFYDQRKQYHSHDNDSGLVITESTCPLCSMGIELFKSGHEHTEDNYDRRSAFNRIDRSYEQSNSAWSKPHPINTFRRYSEIYDAVDTTPIIHPLPQKQMPCTQLVCGPPGNDTLLTTSTCNTCGYALDAFAGLGDYQACVVTDSVGIDCAHFYCATYKIGAAGFATAYPSQLVAVFAAMGWYCYGVEPKV